VPRPIPFPYGFNPQEASDEDDYQFNAGVKGTIATWNWDVGTGFGQDHVGISTIDSYNTGYYSTTGIASPTNFDDGFCNLRNGRPRRISAGTSTLVLRAP
jgi:iron complex outermembrane receptor protein